MLTSTVIIYSRRSDFYMYRKQQKSPLNMNLSLAAAFLIIPCVTAQVVDGVQVEDKFLSKEEMNHFREHHRLLSEQTTPGDTILGEVRVPNSIANRLTEIYWGQPCQEESCSNPNWGADVPTMIITESTNPHVDIFLQSGQYVTDEDRVAFVFLNDNPDASFRHGEVEIPVEEGRLVYFNGNVIHNTVVENGSVHLLGPFNLRNLKDRVGFTGPKPTSSPTTAPKSTKASSQKSTKAPKSTKAKGTNGGSF